MDEVEEFRRFSWEMEIGEALLVLYDEQEAKLWLASPNKLLGGEMPSDLMRQGRYQEVKRVVDQLNSGAYI